MRYSTMATALTALPQEHERARPAPFLVLPRGRPTHVAWEFDAFACREPKRTPYGGGAHLAPALEPSHGAERPDVARPTDTAEDAFLQADRAALSLRGALERTTAPLARTAAALVAAQAWCEFGFARLDDYARERLGRSGRWVRDLAALGRQLAILPRLAGAITGQDGGRPLGRVAAMLVARVATPLTLDDWLARARTESVRALRDAVRAARGAADAEAEDAAAPEDDPADRLLVRMAVPSPILAAFDETLDLFRAVEGGQATVVSFVEALIAEAPVAEVPVIEAPVTKAPVIEAPVTKAPVAEPAASRDADLRVLQAGPAVAAVERALAASTGNWQHLPAHAESSRTLSLAGVTLARFRALADQAGPGGAAGRTDTLDPRAAADLDCRLRALIEIENELEARLGALLADLADQHAWSRLRFAGVGHYGEERLGLSRTTAEDRARLARDLRLHSQLREAYTSGRVSRETAALVARILRDAPAHAAPASGPAGAAPGPTCAAANEAAWVAHATESTVKRMRDEARALGRYRVLGTPRLDAPRPDAPQLSAAQLGAPRTDSAPGQLAPRRGAPAPLDDAAWHASLHREPGLARRRIRQFGILALSGSRTSAESASLASPDVFQAIPNEADTCLALRLPLDLGHQLIAAVEATRRRLTAEADAIPWDSTAPDTTATDATAPDATANDAVAADSAPSRLAARMFSIRCRRLPAWVGLLALLEEFVDTWDDERGMPRRPGDEIYVRDGWRCAAPGCTSRRNLEDHHVVYRSRGGDDDPANRICLCRFHHQRGEHGGLASCRGRAPTGLLWRLGRAGPGEAWYRNDRRVGNPAHA